MDLAFIDVPLWMLITVPMLILLYFYSTRPLKRWKRLGIPGPDGIPLIGNALQLYNGKDKFYANFNKLQKKYGRIFGITLFHDLVLFVTDLDALKQIFIKDFHNFPERYLIGGERLEPHIIRQTLFFSTRTIWSRVRKITTPLFSGAKNKLLIYHINRTARRLSDILEKNAEENIRPGAKKIFAAFSVDVLAGMAVGLDANSLNNPDNGLFRCLRKLTDMDDTSKNIKVILVCLFPFLARIFEFLGMGIFNTTAVQYLQNLVSRDMKDRKRHPENYTTQSDFLQFLLKAEADPSDGRRLSPSEIVAQGMIFMMAGYESMTSMLQFLSFELSQNQNVQAKIVSEINEIIGDVEEPSYEMYQSLKYTEAAVSEILRMYPPLHLMSRKTLNDTIIKGFKVPAGTGIMIPSFSIMRDPEYFENPDEFNPDRFLGENKKAIDPFTFLPFGFGPRQCIGARLGTLATKAALVHMLMKVRVVDATPKKFIIEDYVPLLLPKQNIELSLEPRVRI